MRIEGLAGPVEVLRDGAGIPHCFAQCEHDAFLAQGFVHAEDRLWQMDYDRRRGQGRWAEIAGPRAVSADLFYRRASLSAAVQRDVARWDRPPATCLRPTRPASTPRSA